MTTWMKWDYLCTECDANIEMTMISEGLPHAEMCPRCSVQMTLLSVEDATIHPNNERKEMQSTEYNSNLLVTYKKIEDGIVSYPTIKVTELEYQLDRVQSLVRTINKHDNLISNLEENIVEWYNPNYDKEEVLSALCELIGFTPVKKVRVTGQVYVEVDIDVPADQVEDFDAQQALNDYLVVDYTDGGIVNSHYVEDVDVEW
jgi:DNA-directed RNA polymerase subunit RPC12/RpoP